jgi:hypothetical protein
MPDQINLAVGKVSATTRRQNNKNQQLCWTFKRRILTDCMNPIQKITGQVWSALAQTSRKTRIIAGGTAALALAAFGATAVAPLPDPSDANVKSVSEDLALPNIADQIAALQQNEQQFVHEERVRPGDSLGALFNRLGIEDQQAQAFVRSDRTARAIVGLKNGKRVQAETDENGQLLSLRATIGDKDDFKTVTVTRCTPPPMPAPTAARSRTRSSTRSSRCSRPASTSAAT